MDIETFKNIAQGIQAISISAVAIWGVFKLYASKELDKARVEAERVRRDFETKKGIVGEIDIEVGTRLNNGAIPVFVRARLTNEGADTHILNWKVYPLKIANVRWHDTHKEPIRLLPVAKIPEIVIAPEEFESYSSTTMTSSLLPGQMLELAFYWECYTPGIYLATISAPLPPTLVDFIKEKDLDGVTNRSIEDFSNQFPGRVSGRHRFSISKYFQIDNPNQVTENT